VIDASGSIDSVVAVDPAKRSGAAPVFEVFVAALETVPHELAMKALDRATEVNPDYTALIEAHILRNIEGYMKFAENGVHPPDSVIKSLEHLRGIMKDYHPSVLQRFDDMIASKPSDATPAAAPRFEFSESSGFDRGRALAEDPKTQIGEDGKSLVEFRNYTDGTEVRIFRTFTSSADGSEILTTRVFEGWTLVQTLVTKAGKKAA
jgi:hypothetical protein